MDNRSASFGNPDTRYKFTGKERDIETGYDYFGARYYDSRIGRWLTMDPLAEKYPGLSPYNYVADNPLKYFDPDGKEVKVYSERIPWGTLKKGRPFSGTFAYVIGEPRHSFIRVTTDKMDVILELGGPLLDPMKGNSIAKDAKYEIGIRPEQQEHKVERPQGVAEKDFSFENKIIQTFLAIEKNLPDYDGINGPNSNGFVKFLIESSGGKVNLPNKAFGKDGVKAYYQKYIEYLKQQKEGDNNDKDQNK